MNIENLKGVIPDNIYAQLPTGWTKEQLANFLGQCDHESQGFTRYIENLNYNGDALMQLFRTHFKDQFEANSYARKPECIANRIYDNRLGNGDEASGDGWRYRGKGAIQLTGKTNQEAFLDYIDSPLDADIATLYPLTSAVWYWKRQSLDKIGVTINEDVIKQITHIINGGYNGLENRIARTNYYYAKLQ